MSPRHPRAASPGEVNPRSDGAAALRGSDRFQTTRKVIANGVNSSAGSCCQFSPRNGTGDNDTREGGWWGLPVKMFN